DDYHSNKDKLDKIGFTPINTEHIEEVFIFLTNHEYFTGYIAFERYKTTKLSENELNILISLCRMLNMGIGKQNLTQKYEMELLIKDIILNNEETPIAVVEKYTFKILYHNDFYYSVFPNIAVGGICYELLGRNKQCDECCFDKDLLMNDANQCDHQWIKKAVPYTLENGKEVYVIYSKDSIDYIKKINAVDNLTQALLFRGLEEYYEKFVKVNEYNYALCSLDIDKFKYINEIFDYNTGDKILRKVANVIQNFIVTDENFCRIDGDKFAILLRYDDEFDLHLRMKSLSKKFEDMKNEHFPETRINISAGLTTVNRNISLTNLLNQTIIARKNSKGSHKNNFSYYNPEIDMKIKSELQIEEKIPRAIENDEFIPYIQPKFNIYTKKICGAEALVRWRLSDGTMIFPDQFIPLFEKNGFICQLDFIVYEKVMKHIRKCLDNGFNVYPISVNVSRNHIANKNFLNEFMRLVRLYNIPREYIELEITESIFVEDIQELKNFVSGMKGYKLKVSIDDFGSAYSSLQNLTDIEVDILKIDKGFLNNIDMSETVITKDEILLRNIINLAKELEFHVICEGIESDEQIELLKKVGCEYGQGYVFARPMPIEDYEKQFLQC
ncbi:MAG: bifunctional diguanylate cyclase/phosphodiesterase, partial [bacterium]